MGRVDPEGPLWKNRFVAKYGDKTTNINRVKYAIYKDNYKMPITAFPQIEWQTKWKDLIQKSKKCMHDIKVNMVTWLKPID